MSPTKHTITDSEYTIMKILWASQEKCTVAHVVKALDDQHWTASTVDATPSDPPLQQTTHFNDLFIKTAS